MNDGGTEDAARRAVEFAARSSYGRLVAYLAARWRDVSAAEDALADAFAAALATWPRDGVPERPDAWLLTAAKHRLLHRARHAKVERDPALTVLFADELTEAPFEFQFPDERLKLLFVCAHPAIDPAVRTPLMLQTVLGLDAARIASAFLVAPATMSQRLVRAKLRIRDAGLRFDVPAFDELPERVDAVCEAIYAAYGSAWESVACGADPRDVGLADEAIWLARLIVNLLPDQAEARGLLALLLHCEARRAARRTADHRFVPLAEQDTRLWSRPLIEEAERMLASAARLNRIGHFQIEAAIQSAHSARLASGVTPWPVIVQLYEGLIGFAPTLGARVAQAGALAEAGAIERALATLDGIDATQVSRYQPYWAVRAHVLARLGRVDDARGSFERAVGLSEDVTVRAFLQQRAAALPTEQRQQ